MWATSVLALAAACSALAPQRGARAPATARPAVESPAVESPAESPSILGPELFEPPSSDEEEEFFGALESALTASTARAATGKGAAWDATFWSEFDEASLVADCEDPQHARRLKHFFRVHRVLSMALGSRNRTDAVSRVSLSPVLESLEGARRVRAFNLYPGLDSKAVWDTKKPQIAWLGKFLAFASGDSEVEAELGMANVDGAFASFDQAADEAAEALAKASVVSESTSDSGSDGLFDDVFPEDDDDVFDDPVPYYQQEVNPAASSDVALLEQTRYDATAEAHGRAQLTLGAYFRDEQVASQRFSATMRALRKAGAPFGARHVAIQRQRAGTKTPMHSELQGYLLTAYVALSGSGAVQVRFGAGPEVKKQALEKPLQDAVVVDGTFLHSTLASEAADATWLVVDFWHPDLEAAEVFALERFLQLDEQFVLRRSPTPEVVAALLNNNRPISFLEEEY